MNDFQIGEVVSCRGVPVSIEKIEVVEGSYYPDENGIFYFVKSFWFDGWVRQSELKRY